jgi:hypothetical protein
MAVTFGIDHCSASFQRSWENAERQLEPRRPRFHELDPSANAERPHISVEIFFDLVVQGNFVN